jgi:hypothetical protein
VTPFLLFGSAKSLFLGLKKANTSANCTGKLPNGKLGSNALGKFAQSVHVSRNSLWSLKREELRYCVASLASPNTRNKVAVLLHFADAERVEKATYKPLLVLSD